MVQTLSTYMYSNFHTYYLKKSSYLTKYIYVTTDLHTQNERTQSHVIIFYSESMGGDNYY